MVTKPGIVGALATMGVAVGISVLAPDVDDDLAHPANHLGVTPFGRCGRAPGVAAGSWAGNMWHACGNYSVEGFLDGKGARARELFEGFERLIAACGPYEVAPAKTRLAVGSGSQVCMH